MHERALRAFAGLPAWQRAIVGGLTTCIILWSVWTVILVAFAFAWKLGAIVAALASVFVLAGLAKVLARTRRYR